MSDLAALRARIAPPPPTPPRRRVEAYIKIAGLLRALEAKPRTPKQKKIDEYELGLRAHIKKIVDAAPPLSEEQRDRLRVLLNRS